MPRIPFWIVTISLTALMLTACQTHGPRMVTVTENDMNNTIELSKGDVIEVALNGNPTTGFTWETQKLATDIVQQKGGWEFKSENSTSKVAGAPGKVITRFEAVGTGRTTLQLVYHQAFDKVTPPAETFALMVVVK